MRIANSIMLVVFILCVAVQYNDPDPIRWMAIYGLAAMACVLYLIRRLRWYLPFAIGVVALVWAAAIVPHLSGKSIPLREVFGSVKMLSEPVEEAREMGGLLIVSGWMALLAIKRL